MISDAGAILASPRSQVFTRRPAAPVAPAAPVTPSLEMETAELEITRLTWSVLDGSATLADRQRLAELVKVQHARRHRFDP